MSLRREYNTILVNGKSIEHIVFTNSNRTLAKQCVFKAENLYKTVDMLGSIDKGEYNHLPNTARYFEFDLGKVVNGNKNTLTKELKHKYYVLSYDVLDYKTKEELGMGSAYFSSEGYFLLVNDDYFQLCPDTLYSSGDTYDMMKSYDYFHNKELSFYSIYTVSSKAQKIEQALKYLEDKYKFDGLVDKARKLLSINDSLIKGNYDFSVSNTDGFYGNFNGILIYSHKGLHKSDLTRYSSKECQDSCNELETLFRDIKS